MKWSFALLIFFSISANSQTFTVCTDKTGKRHITNLSEQTLNSDCTNRRDLHSYIFKTDYVRMSEALYREDILLQKIEFDKKRAGELLNSGIQAVKDVVDITFDSDKALDSLYEKQQRNQKKIPFKTHLQSEGFDRLLELQ